MRSEGPLPLTRLADDELRVPAVMALKTSILKERVNVVGEFEELKAE